jgi:retinol dehydrogenase 12
MVRLAMALRAEPAEEGAEIIVYLASSPEVAGVTGEYFCDCRPISPSADAQNDYDAKRLRKRTARDK